MLIHVVQISMEGVHRLARALEDAKFRDVDHIHVYVHSEGRIDALGTKAKQPHVRHS